MHSHPTSIGFRTSSAGSGTRWCRTFITAPLFPQARNATEVPTGTCHRDVEHPRLIFRSQVWQSRRHVESHIVSPASHDPWAAAAAIGTAGTAGSSSSTEVGLLASFLVHAPYRYLINYPADATLLGDANTSVDVSDNPIVSLLQTPRAIVTTHLAANYGGSEWRA